MKKLTLMLVILAFGVCQVALAGGLSRIAATGTTDIGLGSDPDGPKFPHNLGSKLQLRQFQLLDSNNYLEIGMEAMGPKFGYKDSRRQEFTSKDMIHILPAVSYARKLGDDMVWGVDIHTNFGIGASFKDIWYGMDSRTLVSGTYIKPYLSKQLTDKLSIGAGPVLVMSMMNWSGPFDINRVPLPIRVDMQTIGFGYGFQIGAMYQVTDQVAVGMNYLSKVTVDLRGHCSVNAGISVRDNVKLKYEFPEKLDFSVGYQPRADWLLVAQLTYFGYSETSLNTAQVHFDKLPIVKLVSLNWQDNIAINVGASHVINERWTVGGGVTYMNKAITKTADFMTPDANGWAVGGRVKYSPTDSFSVITSLSYGWGLNEVYGREISTKVATAGVSACWKF